VIATGPIFLEWGLYHFIVRVTTIDYDRSFIPDDKQPVYDGWLNVGSTENQQISSSNGEQTQIQIISYYDDLKDFRLEPTKSKCVLLCHLIGYDKSRPVVTDTI
jgi:hypothetical protein